MSDQVLPGLNPAAVVYQMQSWTHADRCICGFKPIRNGHKPNCPYPTTTHYWSPMENGAARSHWMPKPTARAAVRQAAMWAGAVYGLGIPAMQVVELPSGRVVWRDSHQYPAAGAPVAPEWQADVYAAARAAYDADCRAEEATSDPEPVQGLLF
ncbi:hypothetical protein ACIA49_39205 [Kribbella sp. NPDC051587]|uniref:hypothetical protein n=1 Tax=Kribbella sp. NPDC051587 TaxID=3364119 RepID=UPI0037930F3E